MLIYEASTKKWVGIASTAIGGAADELAAGCTGVDLTLSGDLNVTGDLVYDEQTSRNVNITGVSTFNQGIGTNLNITGVSTAATMHVGRATTWGENLVVTGNARVTGILTVGTGSIEIDGDNKTLNIGSGIMMDEDSSVWTGIVTASQFVVGTGGTDILSELSGKTSIGLAIALG